MDAELKKYKSPVAAEEKESEHFEFVVRVQATCSNARPDTYFAVERSTGMRMFVKGPYLTEESVQVPLRVLRLKRACFPQLASIDVRVVSLVPDMFPDVPLGVRRKADRNRAYWFAVSSCLLEEEVVPVRQHETSKWGRITVVDWSKVAQPKTPNPLELQGAALHSWVMNILFRFAVGVPDPADRNFMLMNDGTLYAVDEEGIGCTTHFGNALKKKRCDLLRKHVGSNSTQVLQETSSWLAAVREKESEVREILGNDVAWLIERLQKLQTVKQICSIF